MKYIYIIGFSLIYSFVLNLVYFKKNHLQTRETKYYSILLIVNLIGLVGETMCSIVGFTFPENSPISHFFTKTFMSTLTCFTIMMSLYIYSLCLSDKESIFDKVKKFSLAFLIFSIFVIFALPITTAVGFATGPSCDYVYNVGTVLITLSIITTLVCFKKIDIKKVIPFFAFTVFNIVIAFIQRLNPQVTLTTSMETLVLFIMYFTIENPDLKLLAEVQKARNLSEQTSNEKSNFLNVVTMDIKDKLDKVEVISNNIASLTKNKDILYEVSELNNIVNVSRNNIRQTIDISSLDSKYIKNIKNKYNVKLLLDGVYLSSKEKAHDGVDYRFVLSEGMPEYLFGDSMKVKQILNSVLDNALKYTNKGFVEFRASAIIKYDVCRLILVVEDSGCGIDILKHNEIMTNHNEMSDSDIENIDNKIVSLSVVRKMLNLLGGTISINSENGKGIKVQIILDQRIAFGEKSSEDKVIDKYNETLLSKKRIGVVSLSDKSVKVIKNTLKRDCDVHIFDVTLDLLNELRSEVRYDLVFIDEDMEKIDARSFIYKIKKEGIECPVVVLCNEINFNMKKELLNDGFTGVMSKNLSKDDVKECVNKL